MEVLADAKIKVMVRPSHSYVVEAAIPWTQLAVAPAAGLSLRGDFGVTHGDPAGRRTRLRHPLEQPTHGDCRRRGFRAANGTPALGRDSSASLAPLRRVHHGDTEDTEIKPISFCCGKVGWAGQRVPP